LAESVQLMLHGTLNFAHIFLHDYWSGFLYINHQSANKFFPPLPDKCWVTVMVAGDIRVKLIEVHIQEGNHLSGRLRVVHEMLPVVFFDIVQGPYSSATAVPACAVLLVSKHLVSMLSYVFRKAFCASQ
jgi:hypothetical protein